jgi:hypothetical protein
LARRLGVSSLIERIGMVMIKKLLFLLVVMLTIYPVAELTRIILTANVVVGQIDVLLNVWWEQVFEIAFIWVGYVVGMGLVWRLAR